MTSAPNPVVHRGLPATLPLLPAELLVIIFKNYVPNQPSKESFEGSPTRLCLVCQQWRDLVISSPELWCTLRLTEHQLENLDNLEMWLARSRGRPMSVGIWAEKEDAATITAILEALDILTQVAQQSSNSSHVIKTLEIELPETITMPSIQSARARLFWRKLRSQMQWTPPGARHSTMADIDGVIVVALLTSYPISTTLTEIAIGTPIVKSGCLKILEALPRLHSCTLHCQRVETFSSSFLPPPPPPKILETPNLHKLALIADIPPLTIIEQLTAVNLKNLVIASMYPIGHGWHPITGRKRGLPQFLERSCIAVHELNMENVAMTDVECEAIVKLLELEVFKSPDDARVLTQAKAVDAGALSIHIRIGTARRSHNIRRRRERRHDDYQHDYEPSSEDERNLESLRLKAKDLGKLLNIKNPSC